MKSYFNKILQKQKFAPNWLGIFVNPYYFTRKGLYQGVKHYTSFLSGRLLDFGCGDKPYEKLMKVEKYVGLDIEKSGHDHKNEEIDVYYDGKTIPFQDDYFDSIFSSEVFEHVFDIDLVLREINRVCKVNGHFLLTVPFVWNEHETPYDYGRYTSFGIKHLLKKHGFEIVEHSKTSNYVETMFQMWNTYVFQYILRNKFLQALLTPVFIAPITIVGIALSNILPQDDSFFLNNIVVCKKKADLY